MEMSCSFKLLIMNEFYVGNQGLITGITKSGINQLSMKKIKLTLTDMCTFTIFYHIKKHS